MLSQVHFQSLRALADLTLDLEPFTVLVGPNGCGKSTVLDEIERLCAMTLPGENPNGTPKDVLAGPGALLSDQRGPPPRTTGSTAPMVWCGSTATSRFELQLGASPGQAWWDGAALRLSAGAKRMELSPPQPGEAPELSRTVAANRFLGEDFGWRAQRLALQRQMLLQPSAVGAPIRYLNPSGDGLATMLLHMAANATDEYALVQADLRKVVPHFERLYIQNMGPQRSDGGTGTAYTLDLSFKGAGRIPALRASEGTLFALTLLAALHNPEMPPLILIDDIDHGLHLTAQYQIIKAIRAVMERRPELQVVATSHSPYLLDEVRPEEVRVMRLDAAGHSQARPLTAHPAYARWRGSLRAGELWASVGEDWVGDDSGGAPIVAEAEAPSAAGHRDAG